jgi:hypothetical protein
MATRAGILVLLLLLANAGCSQRIEAPSLDPAGTSARAMAEYDQNKDGFLDAGELERCPGLKRCLADFDRDKDGRLSRDEIEQGLRDYEKSKIGLLEVRCKVTLDTEPLSGATITFEPETFMPSTIQKAVGTTNDRGVAQMQIDGADRPGCRLGIYRVRISKIGPDGADIVPARYSSRTPLGAEVGPAMRGQYSFHLTSRE